MAGIPHDHYEPKTGVEKWLHERLPVVALIYDTIMGQLNWPMGATLTGDGVSFSSSITQNNSGSGTGQGVTRGSVAIEKTLADNAGAALPPRDKIVGNLVKDVNVAEGAITLTFGNNAASALQGKRVTIRPAIVADQLIYDLADYTAMDAAVNMVNYYLGTMDKSLATISAKVPAVFQPEVQAMRMRIQDIRMQMHEQVRYMYQVKGDPYLKIDQLDKVERAMYTNLNATLAANARFGKRQ